MAYPVSGRWEPSIRRGFIPRGFVDVRLPGEGTVLFDLPVTSGKITVDRTRLVRGSGSLVISDPALAPLVAGDSLLSPHGAEIVVKVGVQYPEGSVEAIPFGVFGVEDSAASEASGNITTIQFFDRAKSFERTDHVGLSDFGRRLAFDAIEEVVLEAAPFYPGTGVEWTVNFSNDLANITLPRGTVMDGSRPEFLQRLFEAIGADGYFDRDGNFQVVPIPGLFAEQSPIEHDWVVDAGNDGVLVDVSRGSTRTGVFNGVLAMGSADMSRSQPSAFITDDNPDSLTYWDGPFGRATERIENASWTTNAQCAAGARARLRETTGLQREMSLSMVGNSAMDPGDILLVRPLEGPEEIRLLDRYDYDFASGAMNLGTRSLQFIPPED